MKTLSILSRLVVGLFFLSTLFITSCKKEISNNTAQEEEFASKASSEADAESEVMFNDVFDNVLGADDEVGMGGIGVFGRANNASSNGSISARGDSLSPRCFTKTVIRLNPPAPFPVKIILDFGNGCRGRDGRWRSGKIITIYTNRLVVPEAKATTTFENYKVDSVKVEGTHIITNISTSNVHRFKVQAIEAKLTKQNGNYSMWNSVKYITQIEGLGTPYYPIDDVYKIEGSANGKVKRENLLFTWRSEIMEPLIKKFTCPWIVKGRIKIIRETLSSTSPWIAVLDYGNGVCDNKAVITINGIPNEITLH